MILEKTKFSISKQLSIMAAQKYKKFCKHFLHSSIPNGRPSQNLKARGLSELFLPKNDFKTYFAVNFPKTCRFWRPGNHPKK